MTEGEASAQLWAEHLAGSLLGHLDQERPIPNHLRGQWLRGVTKDIVGQLDAGESRPDVSAWWWAEIEKESPSEERREALLDAILAEFKAEALRWVAGAHLVGSGESWRDWAEARHRLERRICELAD